MTHTLLFRLLLTGILFAGAAGCSSEEEPIRFPTPERLPQIVAQVDETGDGYQSVYKFTYDDLGRIKQYDYTNVVGKNTTTIIHKYTYTGNSLTITRRYGDSPTLDEAARLRRDKLGRTVSVDIRGTVQRMYYNSNGYLQEKPSKGRWIEYLYTPAGEGCNLTECNIYEPRIENMPQQVGYNEKITCQQVLNNLNIDLAYILKGSGIDLCDRLFALSMFDMLGRRSTNLPDTRDVTYYLANGNVEHSYRYEYQHNEKNCITRVERVDEPLGYRTTFLITYKR